MPGPSQRASGGAAPSVRGSVNAQLTTPLQQRQRSQPSSDQLTLNSSAAQEYMRSLTPSSSSSLLKPQTSTMAASQSSHSLRGLFVPPSAAEQSRSGSSIGGGHSHSNSRSLTRPTNSIDDDAHTEDDIDTDDDASDDESNDIPSTCACWENQRYYPIVGWSAKLLLTDRPSWSNESGSSQQTFTDFTLPPGWSWRDGQWVIDRGSVVSDSEGWQYAVEFSTNRQAYESQKELKHMVRRRRWIRRRWNAAKQEAHAQKVNDNSVTRNAIDQSRLKTKMVKGRHLQITSTATSGAASARSTSRLMQPNSPDSGLVLYNRSAASLHSPAAAPPPPPPLTETVYVLQHERYYPIVKWTDSMLPTDKVMPLMDITRHERISSKDDVRPGLDWKWISDWSAVITEGETDHSGWQYAIDFNLTWHNHKSIEYFVRRRQWKRQKQQIVKDTRQADQARVQLFMQRIEQLQIDMQYEDQNPNKLSFKSTGWSLAG